MPTAVISPLTAGILAHNHGTILNALVETTTTAAVWAESRTVVTTNLTDLNGNTGVLISTGGLSNHRNSSLAPTVNYGGELFAPDTADDVSVLRWLQYVLVPAIVLLGVAANFLALTVYVASRLRRLSCSIYLAALAVTDSGFLLCLLSRWAHGIWWTTWNLCPVNYYLTGVFSFLSMAYVLGYTVERYVATCWPLQRKTWCTKRRATAVVVTSLVFALVTFVPTLFMFEVRVLEDGRGMQCGAREDYQTTLKWSSVCTMCLFWMIPTFFTIFFNARIIREMAQHDSSLRIHSSTKTKSSSQHSTLQRNSGDGRYSTGRFSTGSYTSTNAQLPEQLPSVSSSKSHRGWLNSISKPAPNHRRSSYKITRMLVISSSAFIVMGLPYEVLKEYHYFSFDNWSLDDIIDQNYSMTYKVVVFFVYHLYYLNFGVDFFIYNVAGRNFRDALSEVVHNFGERFVKTLTCTGKATALPVRV